MIPNTQGWRELAVLARTYGVRDWEAYFTAARMLAMARFLRGSDAAFLDLGQELTSNGWIEALALADVQWAKASEARSPRVSPFAARGEAVPAMPGFLEVLRQYVFDRIRGSDLLGDAGAMSTVCLQLASELSLTSPEVASPDDASELLVKLSDLRPKEVVYCAYATAAGAALRLALRGHMVPLELPEQDLAVFWSSLGCACGAPLYVSQADPVLDMHAQWPDEGPRYDVAIVAPPFGRKLVLSPRRPGTGGPPASAEAAGVVLAATRARRLAIVWVPAGFLFRTTALDAQFKQQTILRYGLSAIVALPPGAAGGTLISTALLLLHPETRSQDVLVVDHSAGKRGRRQLAQSDIEQIAWLVRERRDGGSSRVVDTEEIASNQFNFTPERYVLSEGEAQLQRLLEDGPSAALEELVDIFRPQATPASADEPDPDDDQEAAWELSVSDLDEVGIARRPQKRLPASPADFFKLRKAELRVGDVVLVTKGSVGKVGYVADIPSDEFWIANQSFAVLRLRRNAPIRDSRVLFRFLSSELGQAQVQRVRGGTTIPTLQMADIKRLRVLLPSAAEQNAIVDQVEGLFRLQEELNRIRTEVATRQKNIWPQVDIPVDGRGRAVDA